MLLSHGNHPLRASIGNIRSFLGGTNSIGVVGEILDRMAVSLLSQDKPDGTYDLLSLLDHRLARSVQLQEDQAIQAVLLTIQKSVRYLMNGDINDDISTTSSKLLSISGPLLREACKLDRVRMDRVTTEINLGELNNLIKQYGISPSYEGLNLITEEEYKGYISVVLAMFNDPNLKAFCVACGNAYAGRNQEGFQAYSDPSIQGSIEMNRAQQRVNMRIQEADMQEYIRGFRLVHNGAITWLSRITASSYYIPSTDISGKSIQSQYNFFEFADSQPGQLPYMSYHADNLFGGKIDCQSIQSNFMMIYHRSYLIGLLQGQKLGQPPIPGYSPERVIVG